MRKRRTNITLPLLIVLLALLSSTSGCIDEPLHYNDDHLLPPSFEPQVISVAENTVLIVETNKSYTNISIALQKINQSQTLAIGPGIYTKPITIEKSITMKAANYSDPPVFELKSTENSSVMITINASHCTLKYLVIQKENQSDQEVFSTGLLIQSTDTIIENNSIHHFFYGLRLPPYTSKNHIAGNIFANNTDGIETVNSLRNTISQNIFENNSRFGVYVGWNSKHNFIQNNIFDNNHEAVRLYSCSQNTVTSNALYNNTYGVRECCGAEGKNTITNNFYKY